jgi:ADP-ribose pyrophosphatase YjhB (NUDIX family)
MSSHSLADRLPPDIRYQPQTAEEITKCGMLPYRYNAEGEREYLLVSPKPKHNSEEVLPFAIARGTRQVLVKHGATASWHDMGRNVPEGSEVIQTEPIVEAAIREGEEELGVTQDMIARLSDYGVVSYKEYGIHLFAARLNDDAIPQTPEDARAARWFSATTIADPQERQRHNISDRYAELVNAIDQALDQELHKGERSAEILREREDRDRGNMIIR